MNLYKSKQKLYLKYILYKIKYIKYVDKILNNVIIYNINEYNICINK